MTYFLKTSAKVLFAALALTSSANAQNINSQYVSVSCEADEYKVGYYEGDVRKWEQSLNVQRWVRLLRVMTKSDLPSPNSLWLRDLPADVLAFLKTPAFSVVCLEGCTQATCEAISAKLVDYAQRHSMPASARAK